MHCLLALLRVTVSTDITSYVCTYIGRMVMSKSGIFPSYVLSLIILLLATSCGKSIGDFTLFGASTSTSPTTIYSIYVGLRVETPSTMAKIGKWNLDLTDPDSPVMTHIGNIDVTNEIAEIRSLSILQDGKTIVAGGATDNTIATIDTSLAINFDDNDSNDTINTIIFNGNLESIHGLCVLPSGDLIAGEDGWSDPTKSIQQFDSNGNIKEDVGTALVSGRATLSTCVAPTNNHLFWIDYDTNDAVAGAIRLHVWGGAAWGETHSSTALASIQALVLNTSTHYAYAFPQDTAVGGTSKVWRCHTGTSNNELSACGEFGPSLENIGGPNQRHIQAAEKLPNNEKIIYISTNSGAGDHYFNIFNPAGSGSAISIKSLTSDLDGFNIDNSWGVYGMVIIAN